MGNDIKAIAAEIVGIRHKLHENPQTGNEETFAQKTIETNLDKWGITYESGWGKGGTGIVATIEGEQTSSGKVIGLRADTDAINVTEVADLPYASKSPGKMHACGHDGHVATMLATARYLSLTKDFNGTVKLIFQPAEEAMGGAKAMIEQGLFEKHRMDSIHAIHNWPALPLGTIAIHNKEVMAASDYFDIVITGKGGHAGRPERCINPVSIMSGLNEFVGKVVREEIDSDKACVLSTTFMQAGSTNSFTAIPSEAMMGGTIRTYDPEVRKHIHNLITARATEFCQQMGALEYSHGYREGSSATINDPEQSAKAIAVASKVFGDGNVLTNELPAMTSEDFGRMLDTVPGSFAWLGQGDPGNENSPHSKPLHNDGYDFNDGAIELGARYFVGLVEEELSL